MDKNQQGFVQPPPYPQQGYAQQPGYPQQGYPQQPVYPQNPGYPPQGPGYPPQGPGYPPQNAGYPPQGYPQQGYPEAFPQQQQGPVYRNMDGGFKQDDEAAPDGFSAGFGDKAIRRNFIRRVYGILMVQLAVTAGIVAIFTFHEGTRLYVRSNRWLLYASWACSLVALIVLACCGEVRRKTPHNFIFLGLFTACEGVVLGCMAAYFQADAVLIAVGITAGVTLGLTLFAFQTKIDFTACGGVFLALLLILFIAGIAMIFIPKTKWVMIGYGAAGALVFSLYLVYDTQLMLGGKHKYALSPEEYIFAALNIYLDVVQLFMYILMIVGGSRSD